MVKPEPSWRSVQRWYEPKKKVLSLTIGPPIVPPNWFSIRSGAPSRVPLITPLTTLRQPPPGFAALSRLLQAFRRLLLWNQNPEPCRPLEPDLVTMLKTEPAARPYSAVNWLVTRRIS